MKFKLIFAFLLVVCCINTAFAWEFNGTVKNIYGNALNHTLINITIWSMSGPGGINFIGSNSTYSNASGWFNVSVSENELWSYKPVATHINAATNALDFIGQSLPEFPAREFINTSNIQFYLRPAGTINITAINSSGDKIPFRYQVKDTKLGYPVAENFNNTVTQAIVYVPRDRNYSIMIYPEQALPVTFNWNNFSANESYNLSGGLSFYNITTHTLQKTFNCTDKLLRVTGYIQNTAGNNFENLSEFTIVPFLLEPGNMIFFGNDASMPYNMSAWNNEYDIYNLSTGYYNITLPGPNETATYILFATVRNGTEYYGGYRNLTLSYSDSETELNFTLYPLMSTDWGSSTSNISMNDAVTWNQVNISTARQQFNLVNSTGDAISNLNAHIEVTVDYTDYGAREFTFMMDVSPLDGNASFYVPLLNSSVKEINIYSQSYSPKRVGTKSPADILANPNITMSTFNPGDIDGSDIMANVQVALYNSNSTCNVPNPPAFCVIADSASIDPDAQDRFNPLSAIIGGGDLNFRMGLLISGIIVEYINVDMLASGPPDALFDDSATTSTSGNFESAMRFGSNGPTIYDYVLVSMPYTEGASNQSGLDENADINMSIPLLYDENWNVTWNTSLNGTNSSLLAGNFSHYSEHAEEWGILLSPSNCTRNQTEFNATNPCYIDTDNNRIWIRLPHFSGTQPSITGDVITTTTTTIATTTTTSGSSGSGSATHTYHPSDRQLEQGYSRLMRENWKIVFNVENASHTLTVLEVTESNVKIKINSQSQEAVISVGGDEKFELTQDNYYDILVHLNSISSSTEANLTIKTIHEKMPEQAEEKTEEKGMETTVPEEEKREAVETDMTGFWFLIVAVAVLVLLVITFEKMKK